MATVPVDMVADVVGASECSNDEAGRTLLAQRPGSTLIRVHLSSHDASALLSGVLECLASESDRPESAEEEGLSVDFQKADIVPGRSEYSFHLAESLTHARIRAHTPGQAPLERWVHALRAAGERWARTDEDVIWDVDMVLGAPTDEPRIFGTITIDGERRTPAGLRIDVFQPRMEVQDAKTWMEFHSTGNRRATIWGEDASYVAAPIGPKARALWVVSDETVPYWRSLAGVEHEESTRLDLELRSGGRLELEAVEKGSGQLLPGLRLVAQVSIEQERNTSSRQITYRPFTKSVVTDARGRCVLSGLPETGYLVVAAAVDQMETQPLMNEYLEGRHPCGIRRLEVDTSGLAQGSLWGEVLPFTAGPDTCLGSFAPPGPPLVRYRRTDEGDRSQHAAEMDSSEGRWSIQGVPGRYEIWSEASGTRISEVSSAELIGGTTTGPLRLQPLGSGADLRIAWVSAPRAELELSLLDAHGTALFRSRGTLASANGECRLPRSGGIARMDTVLRGDGYGIVRETLISDDIDDLSVDLCADESSTFDLRVVGFGSVERAELRLFRIQGGAGGDSVLASCPISGGRTLPVPLPAGLYYYRAEATGLEGLVCGLVRLSGQRAQVGLIWAGVRASLETEDSKGAPSRLVLDSIEGVHLGRDVPEFLREFEVEGLADSVFANSQGCSWVLE